MLARVLEVAEDPHYTGLFPWYVNVQWMSGETRASLMCILSLLAQRCSVCCGVHERNNSSSSQASFAMGYPVAQDSIAL